MRVQQCSRKTAKINYVKTQDMEKINIKNRKGEKIVVLFERSDNPKGLAFVMHGLSGSKEQPHIATFAQAFKDKGFIVVRFDTTNTYGESDGRYEDATTTNYYEDLEDVISWAKTQDWFIAPFWLAGHSLGGISIILYAEKNPSDVKALAPISTVVSGKLSAEARGDEVMKQWQEKGFEEEKSTSIPGLVKRTPWSHMEDRLKYDVLPEVDKLKMPVLLIVGDKDDSTPLTHQQILFDKLSGPKEIHVIKDAPHTFRTERELEEIKKIMEAWIDKYL